jgi:hypothetical protein
MRPLVVTRACLAAGVGLVLLLPLPGIPATTPIRLSLTAELRSVDYCPAPFGIPGGEYLRARLAVRAVNPGPDPVAVVLPAVALLHPAWSVKAKDGVMFERRLEDFDPFAEQDAPDPAPGAEHIFVFRPGVERVVESFSTLPLAGPDSVPGQAAPDGEASLSVEATFFRFPPTWLEAWQRVAPSKTPIVTMRETVTVRFGLRRPEVLNDCGQGPLYPREPQVGAEARSRESPRVPALQNARGDRIF